MSAETTKTSADPVAVALTEMWEGYGPGDLPVVLRLRAALEAAVKLAGEWDARGAEIIGQIELQDCDGALAAFKMLSGQRFRDCAKDLREVISRALLGEENTGGHDGH